MSAFRRFSLSFLVIGLLLPALAVAASPSLSHAYRADGPINGGSLVSFDTKKTGYVKLAHGDDGNRLAGVAVAAQGSLLAIDPATNTVQVAVSGSVPVAVSTLNGPIAVGDQISVSPLGGLGMKASPDSGWPIVGVAQAAFTNATKGSSSQQATNKNGHKTTIHIGYVNLNLTIGASTTAVSQVNHLQAFFKGLTGHVISTPRIIAAMVISLMAVLSLSVLIYASIHASLIALGRNPLAKISILKALRSVLALALFIIVIAGLTDVFLLR